MFDPSRPGDVPLDPSSPPVKTLVVHAHFYQPPRELPGTTEPVVEPTAAPWHDWNARINAECYHPNTAAQIFDRTGLVVDVVSNFEHLSFNIGPTLLAWMERHATLTYEAILTAGRTGRGAFAQGYNHSILPLCNERDKRTQVRWGLADFRHRFGYDSEGLWLPECAVDESTLRVLVEEGVLFTILAPYQATEPTTGLAKWAGGELTLLFYDGHLSSDVAFGIDSLTSEALIERVTARPDELVTIATDGETFGHHHHFADRTLAYALTRVAPIRGVRIASAASVVRDSVVTRQRQVRESAWSCAHGIERWRSDCGCQTGRGTGWHQRWRAPLRHALDVFRDAAADLFERRGASLVVGGDPWAVRDAYIDVVVGAASWDEFAASHVRAQPPVVRQLLEAQRASMAMYTSCGWFFDDIAGIEARIVLRWADALARAMAALDEALPEDRFIDALVKAEGNDGLDGLDVWASVRRQPPAAPAPGHWAPAVNPRDVAVAAIHRLAQDGAGLLSFQSEELTAIAHELGVWIGRPPNPIPPEP